MTPAIKGLPAGLSERQVEHSRKESGSNALTARERTGFGKKYLASLGDPIIKILLAALAINVLFLFRGEGWFETVGIAIAVFLASFLSTLSEYGSESAFIRLQEQASKTTCRVRRDGRTVLVPSDELVCGDIVLLGAGEGVPADGILLAGKLSVDQSALNGESREAQKLPGENSERVRHWDLSSSHMLFRGTVIAAGEGVMILHRVGDSTFFGSMAQSLQDESRESPLKQRLGKLAKTISRIGYIAAILVAFADLFNRVVMDNGFVFSLVFSELTNVHAMLENLLHAATLAISIVIVAVPEGLPMMITVVLSSSMFRMLKDKVMVRKLTGIETAGSVNILFTDKTGTLTYGKLSVGAVMDGEGRLYREREDLSRYPAFVELIALSGSVNTSATLIEGKAEGGNATDRAMLDFVSRLSNPPGYEKGWFQPFDSERKYSAATATGPKTLHLVKGAPEMLLARCKAMVTPQGEIQPFAGRAKVMSQCRAASEQGERVVCLCLSENAPQNGLPESLTFLCLAIIRDGLRKEARGVIEGIHQAGVQVVMITGDSKETAASIAREAGLMNDPMAEVLTSTELSQMTDYDIASLLPRLRVVARALPTDKSRLVRIAQKAGMVTAMTGDGINDAPALKLADVGFAMGSGTQVAKEAGDIVILDDNISSISRAILYGRTIFKSIQKFLVFQLTMNVAAVGVSLIGPFIGIDVPVTVMQMLWINIIMDTLAGLAFAGEAPLAEYMREPPKTLESPVLTGAMARQVAATGAYMILICVLFLLLPSIWRLFDYDQATLMTGFFALFVFAGIFSSFCARSDRINHFKNLSRNRSFIGIMSVVFVVQLAMIYYGGVLFRTNGLSRGQLVFVLLLAVSVIPADIVRKLALRRFQDRRRPKPETPRINSFPL